MGGDRPAVEMGRDRGSAATDSPAGKAQALVRPETHFLALEKTLSYLLLNILFWIRVMFGRMGLKFEFQILKLWQIFILWI
jgi:hypothetical protein